MQLQMAKGFDITGTLIEIFKDNQAVLKHMGEQVGLLPPFCLFPCSAAPVLGRRELFYSRSVVFHRTKVQKTPVNSSD